jgi:hypothetical protein
MTILRFVMRLALRRFSLIAFQTKVLQMPLQRANSSIDIAPRCGGPVCSPAFSAALRSIGSASRDAFGAVGL